MKKTVLLLIILFSACTLFAQDTYLKWARQFAGTSVLTYSRGYSIETDANGNVYSLGGFTGTVDFDPGPDVFNLAPVSTDVYISKLDSAGKFLWAKQLTGSFGTLSNSLSLDKDFNIIVTGTFQASVDFDPGPGVFYLTATGGSTDLFVLKLNADGEFLWVKQIGAATGQTGTSLNTTDSFGDIYFTGSYRGTLDFDPGPGVFSLTTGFIANLDIFICKLDAAGNFVWAKAMGGSQPDAGFGINCDKNNDLIINGIFRTTVDFDPGAGVFNLISNGSDDIFILKLNAAGVFIWAKSIGGSSADIAYETIADNAGNIYATGSFMNTVDFDPGPAAFNLTSAGGNAIFILKLDAAGNFVWAKGMGGSVLNNAGLSIDLDKKGNVYTSGSFTGTGDFDPGPGIFTLNATVIDMFISKLNNKGDFIWAKSAGGASFEQCYAISVDRSLNIYGTGQFGATVDFDLEAPVYNLTAIPVSDAFVLKVAQCASAINTTINASICEGQSYYAGGANQTTTGIYRDTLETLIGCDSIIITNLTVHANPKPDLGPDGKICSNTQTVLDPGLFSNYLWHDNSTKSTFTVNSPGKYWVTVTDANTCSATDTINILSIDTIPRDFLPADQELCYGNVLSIAVPNYFTYLWSTGSIGDFIDITNFGTYNLTVKDYNSCIGTDTIIVSRKNCIYMAIPNAFSPDGNLLNDIFKPIINQAIKSYGFIVFNRYGQKVFETTDYAKGWDGNFMGKPQLSGSYVYRIKYTNIFGVETVENGSVLLIR